MQRVREAQQQENVAGKYVRGEVSNGAFSACLTHVGCHWYQGLTRSSACSRCSHGSVLTHENTRVAAGRWLATHGTRRRLRRLPCSAPALSSCKSTTLAMARRCPAAWRAAAVARHPCVPRCSRERRE